MIRSTLYIVLLFALCLILQAASNTTQTHRSGGHCGGIAGAQSVKRADRIAAKQNLIADCARFGVSIRKFRAKSEKARTKPIRDAQPSRIALEGTADLGLSMCLSGRRSPSESLRAKEVCIQV